jgi:hypothetical protein
VKYSIPKSEDLHVSSPTEYEKVVFHEPSVCTFVFIYLFVYVGMRIKGGI